MIAHLIEEAWEGDFAAAVRGVLPLLEGSYAILALCADTDEVVAARERSPLVLGLGDDEFFACSDATPPIVAYTRNILVMEDGDLAVIRRGSVAVENGGETVVRETTYIDYDVEASRKGGFEHFMLKEIFEQPDVFQQSFRLACKHHGISMLLSRARGISVIACGTSYNAALLFRYFVEKECGVPVRVDLASEYRYLSTPGDEIVIAVSQSGETADTLSALKKRRLQTVQPLQLPMCRGGVPLLVQQMIPSIPGGPGLRSAWLPQNRIWASMQHLSACLPG